MPLGRTVNRVLGALGYARPPVQTQPESPTETYARLYALGEQSPRHQPGEFRFPFGSVAYVDALSLRTQYYDIFLKKGYDFVCDRNDPLILDCGGNIGLSTIRFKDLYPRSRVVVFEPDPSIAEVLRSNIGRLALTGVEVVEAAVWHRAAPAPFAVDGADMGCIGDQGSVRQVKAVRLADWIKEPIDLLKLDIEGAEYDVILDLCQTGRIGQVHRLVGELHVRNQEWDRVIAVLEALRRQGLRLSMNGADSAPFLRGEAEPTPFDAVPDGKCLLHLYAWQPA